jgi:hypothetical protein
MGKPCEPAAQSAEGVGGGDRNRVCGTGLATGVPVAALSRGAETCERAGDAACGPARSTLSIRGAPLRDEHHVLLSIQGQTAVGNHDSLGLVTVLDIAPPKQ